MADRRRESRVDYCRQAYVTYGGKRHPMRCSTFPSMAHGSAQRREYEPHARFDFYIPLPSEQGWRLCFRMAPS